MPLSNSPSMLLFYTLDQSQPQALRTNLGSLGSAQDLTPSQSTGTDGIPSESDGNGGRALDIFIARTGWTTASRGLKGPAAASGAVHTARRSYPLASAAGDFGYGARFTFRGLNTGGGGIESEFIFGLFSPSGVIGNWGFFAHPDDPTSPTAAKMRVLMATGNEVIDGSGWTSTGSPPTFYFLKDEKYRVVIRVFFAATGYKIKLYIVRESTGDLFTFVRDAAVSTGVQASFDSDTDARVWVSMHGASSVVPFGGMVDECWFYGAPMTDAEATSLVYGGFTSPFTPPDFRVVDHKVYVAVAREGAAFPKTRPLPVGCMTANVPADLLCQRVRVRIEGWHAGRPWLVRNISGTFDTAGHFGSKAGNALRLDDLTTGIHREGGELPPGAFEDCRNVELSRKGPRRRRGHFVRRNVAADQGDGSANAFYFFRTDDQALYGLYKVGTKLYEETGSASLALDSGWNPQQLPSFLFLDERAVILTGARRRTWRGTTGSVDSFSIAAGATGTVADSVGGTLNGSYYYAWTEYDPVTGDESAPKVTAVVSPSTEKVTLTMSAVNADTRFSQRRIYRTNNGGSPPALHLIATISTATSYIDTGDADGVTVVGQVADTDGELLGYITGEAPDSFSFGVVHMERAFYSGGATNPDRIYPTEALEVQRWFTGNFLRCEGPVLALASWGHMLVAFTANTVEIYESDWVRDADGDWNVQRTVIRGVGCLGHAAVWVEGEELFWAAFQGVYHMEGRKPVPLSDPIADVFPYINHGISRRVVTRVNHNRRQLWVSVPHTTLQDENSDRFQTVLVLDLRGLERGERKWTFYELEASLHGPFDDDLNGTRYGIIDHLGVFKIAETYEGDGAEGDESFTTDDEGGLSGSVGISSIVGSVVTVFGSPGWVAGALRGFGVVLRDISTGILYWHLIADNTTTAFTVVGIPNAALAARDAWHIGGMRGFFQTAEQALNTPNEKVLGTLHYELADLTQTALYL